MLGDIAAELLKLSKLIEDFKPFHVELLFCHDSLVLLLLPLQYLFLSLFILLVNLYVLLILLYLFNLFEFAIQRTSLPLLCLVFAIVVVRDFVDVSIIDR